MTGGPRFNIRDACGVCGHTAGAHAWEDPHGCCRYDCECPGFTVVRCVMRITGHGARDVDANGAPVDPPPFSEPPAPRCPFCRGEMLAPRRFACSVCTNLVATP